MTLPAARVVHRTEARMRIRIPEKKADAVFFSDVAAALADELTGAGIQTNPETGSILVTGKAVEPDTLAVIGHRRELFRLDDRPVSMAQQLSTPVAGAHRTLDTLSGGRVDLAGVIFLALVAFGVYELARGNFRSPPWYTAFWYAFGVFTKSIIEQKSA